MVEAGLVSGAQTVSAAGRVVFAIARDALADGISTLADLAFPAISVRDAAILTIAARHLTARTRGAVPVRGGGAISIFVAAIGAAGIVGISTDCVAWQLRNTRDSLGAVLKPIVATNKATIGTVDQDRLRIRTDVGRHAAA